MSDQVLDDPGIVIPLRDCDAETALDTAVQHARRASQLTVQHNPTAKNHALSAAAWAQVAAAKFIQQGTGVTAAGEGPW